MSRGVRKYTLRLSARVVEHFRKEDYARVLYEKCQRINTSVPQVKDPSPGALFQCPVGQEAECPFNKQCGSVGPKSWLPYIEEIEETKNDK